MNENELLADKKVLLNAQDLYKDLAAGDPYALKKFEELNLDVNAIKKAISFLTQNDNLSEEQKAGLLAESWRINFRAKPPTPEEFLTEKYLGPTAKSLYPKVRKAFLEFLDPASTYRDLILYPHIGWGKDQPLDSKVYISETECKLMKDIEVGDSVLTPSGEKATVSAVIDWSEDDVYELELEDGKTMRCGPHHLHHVSYKKDSQGNPVWETVETLFLLEHPDYDFEFQEIFSLSSPLKKITYIDREPTRCISLNTKEGLYITDNGIVTHNSFLSTLVTLYLDVCVSLMKDPCKFFGLSKATSFSSMMVSYSLNKSREVLLEPFQNILSSSPFFEKVTRRESMADRIEEFKEGKPVDKLYYTTASRDKSSILEFDSGLTVKIASSPQTLLGLTLITVVFSELAFFTDAGKSSEYIMRLYNDGKGRIYSRLKGNYYGRSILDSSPNSLTNAIDDYVVNEAPKSSLNYIVKGSVWQCDPDPYKEEFEKGDTFKIYAGGKGQPPKILSEIDPLLLSEDLDRSKILEVPNSFRHIADNDLPKFLKDYGGIPSGVADSIITDFSIIEDMFNNEFKNIYTSIQAPANESPKNLIWNQIKDTFFKWKADHYEFYYLPHIQRCISVDQSEISDITSISMSHIERDVDSGDTHYVIDFTIAILPDSRRLNLASIEEFIKDLKTLGRINITAISFDNFQSATTIQNLKRDGFEVEKLSVDRTTGPYLNLLSLLNRRRISCGKNIFLKNNLKSLHMVHSTKSDHVKIDHDASRDQVITGTSDWEDSFLGYYGKDVSDSVAAVVELCSHYLITPVVNWEGGPSIKTLSEEKMEATRKLNLFLSNL